MPQARSFSAARTYCRDVLGGDLASIESEAEKNEVLALLTGTRAWIGLTRTVENPPTSTDATLWRWVDGSAYIFGTTYTNWANGEPNDYQNNENCAVMYSNSDKNGPFAPGEWNDEFCTATYPFVCVSDVSMCVCVCVCDHEPCAAAYSFLCVSAVSIMCMCICKCCIYTYIDTHGCIHSGSVCVCVMMSSVCDRVLMRLPKCMPQRVLCVCVNVPCA